MNKFEGSIENLTENTSQEKKIEEQENAIENFNKEFQLAENEELSSIENKETIISRLKKTMSIVTAGVMLLSATPAFAQEKGKQLTEQQKIELQIQELQQKQMQLKRQESEIKGTERLKELNDSLSYFNIDGLELGESKFRPRCLCEHFGIYLNEEYLEDIYSSKLNFTNQELIEDTAKVLKENGIKNENNLSEAESNEITDVKINISPDAEKMLEKWGGSVNSNTIVTGGPENLTFDSNTIEIQIISAGEDMLFVTGINKNGSRDVVTCINKIVKSVSRIK